MTLRRFVLLVDRYKEQRKTEDRRAGEVVAILYNINRDAEKDPNGIDWQDVFPEWKEPQAEQSEEEMFDVMSMLAKRTEDSAH